MGLECDNLNRCYVIFKDPEASKKVHFEAHISAQRQIDKATDITIL